MDRLYYRKQVFEDRKLLTNADLVVVVDRSLGLAIHEQRSDLRQTPYIKSIVATMASMYAWASTRRSRTY